MEDMKKKINDLRFGLTDPITLEDSEIVTLLDYCLPGDVISLLFYEIKRRRNERIGYLRLDSAETRITED